MSARHVDSTSPERVKRSFAKGRTKDGVTTIHTVCMVCRTVIIDGPKRDGRSSHGLCGHPDCERITTEPPTEDMVETMARRSEVAYGRYMTAPGSREDGPATAAYLEWERCHRRFRTALKLAFRTQNGPDGGASQRAGSDETVRTGDRTPKVATSAPSGNSGRNGSYVLTVGSPGGTVARYRYADFDAMLADVERVAEKHRGPMAFGNEDRADLGDDGLSDAERELLEELL